MLNAESRGTEKRAGNAEDVSLSIRRQQSVMTDSPNRIVPAHGLPYEEEGSGAAAGIPGQNCAPLNLKINAPVTSRPSTESYSSIACEVPRIDTLKSVIRNKLRDFFTIPETNTLILQEKTRYLADFYLSLALEDKSHFVQILSDEYSVEHSLIEHLAGQITYSSRNRKSESHLIRVEDRLRHALVPRYQHLFTQFSRLEQGIKVLLSFRADVINMLRNPGVNCDSPAVQSMNSTLFNLIHQWMSMGSLRLERITWESPCDLLQRICSYEAVQSIRNWADLKRRVGPNRRCYAFTHSSLPRDPILVVHTALASSLQQARNIQSILGNGNRFPPDRRAPSINDPDVPLTDLDDVDEDPKGITTAIFYSITSTQKGLQGIELGTHQLKKVIDKLSIEFPRLHQFYSLSPIPGFRDWLLMELNRHIHLLEMGESAGQLLTNKELQDMTSFFQTPEHRVYTILRDLLLRENWIERAHLTTVSRLASLCQVSLPRKEERLCRQCCGQLSFSKRWCSLET